MNTHFECDHKQVDYEEQDNHEVYGNAFDKKLFSVIVVIRVNHQKFRHHEVTELVENLYHVHLFLHKRLLSYIKQVQKVKVYNQHYLDCWGPIVEHQKNQDASEQHSSHDKQHNKPWLLSPSLLIFPEHAPTSI